MTSTRTSLTTPRSTWPTGPASNFHMDSFSKMTHVKEDGVPPRFVPDRHPPQKFEVEDGKFGIVHFPGDCVKCRETKRPSPACAGEGLRHARFRKASRA